jgi:GTP:adenosylcobinamide-phosphate guanylyltransferase
MIRSAWDATGWGGMPDRRPLGVVLAGGGAENGPGADATCLALAGGRPLVLHALDALESAGVRRRLVVAGPQAEAVRAAVGGRATVVAEHRPWLTGGLHTFLQARRASLGPLLVLDGDVLLDARIVRALARVAGCALAWDPGVHVPGTAGVSVRDGIVTALHPAPDGLPGDGAFVGALRLDPAGARLAFAAAARLLASGHAHAPLSLALNAVIRRRPVRALAVEDRPWLALRGDVDRNSAAAWPQAFPAVRRPAQTTASDPATATAPIATHAT